MTPDTRSQWTIDVPLGMKTLTLQMSQNVEDALTAVQARIKAPHLADVVRRALALYDLVTEHEAEGGTIVFRTPAVLSMDGQVPRETSDLFETLTVT